MGWLGGVAGAFGGAGDYFQKERDREDSLRQILAGLAPHVDDPAQLESVWGLLGGKPGAGDIDFGSLAELGGERETQRVGAMHEYVQGLEEGHGLFQPGASTGPVEAKFDLGEVGRRGVSALMGPLTEEQSGLGLAPGMSEHRPALMEAIENRRAGFETAREGRVGEAGRTAAATTKGAGDAEIDLIIGQGANERYRNAVTGMARDNAFATSEGQAQAGISSFFKPFNVGGGIGFKTGEQRAQSQGDIYSSMYQPTANKQRTVVMDPNTQQLTHAYFDPDSGRVTIPDYPEGEVAPAAAPDNYVEWAVGQGILDASRLGVEPPPPDPNAIPNVGEAWQEFYPEGAVPGTVYPEPTTQDPTVPREPQPGDMSPEDTQQWLDMMLQKHSESEVFQSMGDPTSPGSVGGVVVTPEEEMLEQLRQQYGFGGAPVAPVIDPGLFPPG